MLSYCHPFYPSYIFPTYYLAHVTFVITPNSNLQNLDNSFIYVLLNIRFSHPTFRLIMLDDFYPV